MQDGAEVVVEEVDPAEKERQAQRARLGEAAARELRMAQQLKVSHFWCMYGLGTGPRVLMLELSLLVLSALPEVQFVWPLWYFMAMK